MTIIHRYDPAQAPPLAEIWPFVGGLAETIAETSRGKVSAEHIRGFVERGEMQLWLVLGDRDEALALVVTEIKTFPMAKVCVVHGLAGHERGRWMHHLGDIEGWARELGCTRMEVRGRKGMARVLPDYKMTSVFLEKDLH